MEEWESRFSGRPIQAWRRKLATRRRGGAARLKRARRSLRWFVRGALIGAAWAVLSAPRSGAEAREAVGQRLRPLVEMGTSLLAWRLRQQHMCQVKLAERQAPGEAGKAHVGGTTIQRMEETSGVDGAEEEVERSVSRRS